MGCTAGCGGSSSCFWSHATAFSPPSASKSKSFFPFLLSKLTNTITTTANTVTLTPIFCCFTGSYSRPWYNPLRTCKSPQLDSLQLTRDWVIADENPIASQERFTIVSYNILAERNAWKHRDMYPNVPYDYLKWNYRKKVICEELIGLNPDVICLQEVDKYLDLLDMLKKAGYVGSYKRRSGDKVDGCAMFWKAEMFRLLEGESIEFMQLGLRDNVAQLFVLEEAQALQSILNYFSAACKGESRRILVGNIHVIYNPSRGEIKLAQIRHLFSRAEIQKEKWGDIPVVLAGDFNCTPQSAIYKFLSSSELNIMLYNRKEMSGQKSCHPSQVFGQKKDVDPLLLMDRFFKSCWTDEEVKVATGDPKGHLAMHPLKLKSSYFSVQGSAVTRDSNGEPVATSYHGKFFGTVDYLWYSDGIVPLRVLDTLPFDILKRTGGLPCKRVGSDHLALVCEFAFTRGGNDTTIATTN